MSLPTRLPAVRAATKGRTPSRVQRRLIEPYDDSEAARELAFQHTAFCQTSLPYRDPGDEMREWQRTCSREGVNAHHEDVGHGSYGTI